MNLVQLKDVELFKSLPDSTLSELSLKCQTVILQPGETLFKDGDPGHSMYAVLDGHLTIFKEDQEIAQINNGQVFGEMAIIESKNRSATVQAAEQTTLMEITKPQFDLLLASNEQFLFSLLTTLSDRSRGNISDLAMGYKKKEAQERISVHLLRILDDSPNEIYIIDSSDHRFVRGNSLALNNLGYDKDEIAKCTIFDVIKNLTPDTFDKLSRPLLNNGNSFATFQGLHRRKNGTEYNSEIRLKLLQKDTSPLYVAMAVDKTERLLMEERLETLAYFDPVTNLPNIALAKDRLRVSISQADRREKLIAVVIVSIVNYKSISTRSTSYGRTASQGHRKTAGSMPAKRGHGRPNGRGGFPPDLEWGQPPAIHHFDGSEDFTKPRTHVHHRQQRHQYPDDHGNLPLSP